MDKKWRDEWLKALRSGDYEQGNGALVVPSGEEGRGKAYCCLGVLCEIHPDVEIRDGAAWHKVGGPAIAKTNSQLLPATFRASLEMDEELQRQLAYRNDQLGWTFEEIADYIEENTQ